MEICFNPSKALTVFVLWHVMSLDFLCSFHTCHCTRRSVVMSQIDSCFLKLPFVLGVDKRCRTEYCNSDNKTYRQQQSKLYFLTCLFGAYLRTAVIWGRWLGTFIIVSDCYFFLSFFFLFFSFLFKHVIWYLSRYIVRVSFKGLS